MLTRKVMKKPNYSIDDEFLKKEFNPFKLVCEVGIDARSQSLEYRAFNDYLSFLKIISNRLAIDSKNYEEMSNYDPGMWNAAYQLQLDIESFVIFSHILLDKMGILVGKLLELKIDDSPYLFKHHKKFFLKNRKICSKYSELLSETHWYDQNFSFLRDKIIEHSRALAGSMRNYKIYRRINKYFGGLNPEDQAAVESFVDKYGKKNIHIQAIKPNPNLMLDEFLNLIMEYNIELSKDDLTKLGEIVQRSGGTIDVTILSRHIRKLLMDTAALFPKKELVKEKA